MNNLFLLLAFLLPYKTLASNVEFKELFSNEIEEDKGVTFKAYFPKYSFNKAYLFEVYENEHDSKKGLVSKHVMVSGQKESGEYFNLANCLGNKVVITGILSSRTNIKQPVVYSVESISIDDENAVNCLN